MNPIPPQIAHSVRQVARPPSERSWADASTSRRALSCRRRWRRDSASRSSSGGRPVTFPRTRSANSLPPTSGMVEPRR